MLEVTQRAMLATLSISAWTARSHDKKVSDKVAADHGAKLDIGRYNKVLIDNAEIKKITTCANDARTWNYGRTLPWLDNGARILPAAFFDQYTEAMRNFRHTFDAAVAQFVVDYPRLKETAKETLNGLYKEDDYPKESKIRDKFAFSVQYMPLPDAADFRVKLDSAEIDQIRRSIQTATDAALQRSMGDVWKRAQTVAAAMVDRLSAYDGTKAGAFRDTLVENVRDLVALLPGLNIAQDPNLDAIAREMKAKLCGFDAQVLRDDPHVRQNVKSDAQALLDRMAGYCS